MGHITKMKSHEFRCLSHSHLYRQNLFNYTSLYCTSQTWHIFYKLKPGFCAPGSAWKVGMETSPARHGHLVPVPGGPAHQRAHYLNIILSFYCSLLWPQCSLHLPLKGKPTLAETSNPGHSAHLTLTVVRSPSVSDQFAKLFVAAWTPSQRRDAPPLILSLCKTEIFCSPWIFFVLILSV